jgi:heterodisulfide reductase subunit B2
MKLAYYPGCSLHSSSELYDIQCRKVLEILGVELKELDDWNCCGATSAEKTDDFLAVALPARNLGIADSTGLSEIMVPCSSCYNRMMVARKTLLEDGDLRAEINRTLSKKVEGRILVSSILDTLLTLTGTAVFKKAAKLEGLKPACYYGCLLTRFPSDIGIHDDVENPQGMEKVCRELGAAPVDWGCKTDCCGASAAINDTETSMHLISAILMDAASRGANCIVTTCPMCQMNLDACQEKLRMKFAIPGSLPVFFITELLGVALGVNEGELRIDRHFTDATGVLKGIKIR